MYTHNFRTNAPDWTITFFVFVTITILSILYISFKKLYNHEKIYTQTYIQLHEALNAASKFSYNF